MGQMNLCCVKCLALCLTHRRHSMMLVAIIILISEWRIEKILMADTSDIQSVPLALWLERS